MKNDLLNQIVNIVFLIILYGIFIIASAGNIKGILRKLKNEPSTWYKLYAAFALPFNYMIILIFIAVLFYFLSQVRLH